MEDQGSDNTGIGSRPEAMNGPIPRICARNSKQIEKEGEGALTPNAETKMRPGSKGPGPGSPSE